MRAWAGVHLPRATYVLPGGELRYGRDWWHLFDDAGGIEGVHARFADRYRAAGGDDLEADWAAYAEPQPDAPAWCRTLRDDVDALDRLARPFAACDRERFGRPTSRDRLIDLPRERFPHAFQG